MKYTINVSMLVLLITVNNVTKASAGDVLFTLSQDVCVAEKMVGGGAPSNGNLVLLGSKNKGSKISSNGNFRLCARFQRRCGDPMSDWYCSTQSGSGTYTRMVP